MSKPEFILAGMINLSLIALWMAVGGLLVVVTAELIKEWPFK